MSTVRTYVELARPFTLIAPALGFVSGALTAIGAHPREVWHPGLLVPALIGCVMAMVFNAGNNALNQIYDLEIDRVNKGKRPLPSGRLTIREAWIFTNVTYVITLVLAWLVAPGGRHECFWIVLVAMIATYIYSMPPLRTKQRGIWANVTIAIPRGVLLKVAGWSAVKTVRGRRAVVHRHGVRPLPARRVDDQGFRGHGRRPAGWLPHAADRLRREARGVDDLAVVRPAVSADQRRHGVRHPHRQRRCCSTRSAS